MSKVGGISRREALAAGAALSGITFLPSRVLGRGNRISPNDKVNIAVIGIGGQYGTRAFMELKDHNFVGLCDVDWRQIGNRPNAALGICAKYPEAKKFDDWRVMLHEMDKKIDAVLVCSADHHHAHPTIAAMKMGKHVYTEKCLAHSYGEVQAMLAAERKYKVTTQMGTQGHASDDVRSMVEWIRNGAIGTVKEAHIYEGMRQPGTAASAGRSAASGGRAGRGPTDAAQPGNQEVPIPPEVKWDQWIGPAPMRPYDPSCLQGGWRRWVDFSAGSIGDHGAHFADVPVWALDLDHPETIEADTEPEYNPATNTQTWPRSTEVRFTYPARGKRSAISLTWHSGREAPIPVGWNPAERFPSAGGMFVGTHGWIVFGEIFQSRPYPESLGKPPADAWPGAAQSSLVRLFPDDLSKSYKRPPRSLPRPGSQWLQWIDAIRAGKPGDTNFQYAGGVAEVSLLGNIAIRNKGKVLHFDAKKGKFTDDAANKLLYPRFREGWPLPA
jgi:predicted dehydrogenase